jgi:hypothetical protein
MNPSKTIAIIDLIGPFHCTKCAKTGMAFGMLALELPAS